jgi:Flp pilus assembly protein TadD
MADQTSNHVFISYRREVGGILAMALWQNLHLQGIDAFYDIESIGTGLFGEIILGQIEARPYFVLVLTPGTLERCSDPGDWLCREIEHAVATERVIIPAFTPNFDFGDCDRLLPDGLGRTVRAFQAQELPQRWFKAAVGELIEKRLLLISLPTTPTPAKDELAVAKIQGRAKQARMITEKQLSAQEFFERAYNRPDDDLDGTIADYSEAIKLDPDYAMAYYNRAVVRSRKGDLDGTIADLNEAIRLKPEYAAAFCNRGWHRREKGDLDGAIADLNEAIRLDPEDGLAFNNRADVRIRRGDLVGAIADCNEAIRLDPTDSLPYANRGDALERMGNLDEAISAYDEAIRLNPKFAEAFDYRASARRANGDVDGANADKAEAHHLDPARY